MSKITTEYRTFTIHYSELSEDWYATRQGGDYATVAEGFKSLAEIKKKLDKISKDELGFKRFTGWRTVGGWGESAFEVVEVTSITERGEAWIINSKTGRREKVNAASIFPNTPDNEAKVKEVNIRQAGITQLRQEQATIVGTMTRYTVPPIIIS